MRSSEKSGGYLGGNRKMEREILGKTTTTTTRRGKKEVFDDYDEMLLLLLQLEDLISSLDVRTM
jgi:hypothetical protein